MGAKNDAPNEVGNPNQERIEMITKDDAERPGTIEHAGLEITGQVLKVNEENETFTFATAEFGSITLDANQWNFRTVAPSGVLTPGWYEDVASGVADGAAPWYVDSNQVVHSFFVNKEGDPAMVSFPVTEEMLHTLVALQK